MYTRPISKLGDKHIRQSNNIPYIVTFEKYSDKIHFLLVLKTIFHVYLFIVCVYTYTCQCRG